MSHQEEILDLLRKIEQHQREALENQRASLELSRQHFGQASKVTQNAIELQRTANRRQKIALLAVLFLFVLACYVALRWRII